jgi:hemerythrin-like domain-containing protein
MKRNENLQPLSRQHHNGLLASLLLQKGVNKQGPLLIMKDFVMYFFEMDLNEHFRLEEEFLIPIMSSNILLKSAADKILADHAALRSLRDKIVEAPSYKDITAFSTLLEQHIRYEERVAFNEAEQLLTEDQLQSIGSSVQEFNDKNCMSYPVKFWE